MKKLIILFIATIFLGTVSQANALLLDFDDAYYLGHIDDGIPSSTALEPVYINNLTTLAAGAGPITIGTEDYDRIGSTLTGPFPEAVSTGAVKYDGADQNNNTFNATGFEYILGKYDGPNDGSYVWFFDGGFTEQIELPSFHLNFELSHISAYNANSVPEAATMLLFGTGLIGLAGIGRKHFKKNKLA
jgi:hypothetical protein